MIPVDPVWLPLAILGGAFILVLVVVVLIDSRGDKA